MGRLRAVQFVASGCQFGIGFLGGGRGAPEIVLHFRDLERSQKLPFLNAIANVHLDLLDVSGNLGHDVHFLKRLELRGKDQITGETRARHQRHRDGWNFGGCRFCFGAAAGAGRPR